MFLDFVAAFSDKDGDLFLGRAGDEIKEFGLFFLFQEIIFNF